MYKGTPVNKDFRIDLLVEEEIIIEVKSVDALAPIHEAQLLSYLKLSNNEFKNFRINKLSWLDWRLTT